MMCVNKVPIWIRVAFALLCAVPISIWAPLAAGLAVASLAQLAMGKLFATVPLLVSIGGVVGTFAAWSFVICGVGLGKFGKMQLFGLVFGVLSLGTFAFVQLANAPNEAPALVIAVLLLPIAAGICCSAYVAVKIATGQQHHMD